jgi:hypothetical protein
MTGRCCRWRHGSKVAPAFENLSETLLRRIGARDKARTRSIQQCPLEVAKSRARHTKQYDLWVSTRLLVFQFVEESVRYPDPPGMNANRVSAALRNAAGPKGGAARVRLAREKVVIVLPDG